MFLRRTTRKGRTSLFQFYFVTGGVIFMFSLIEMALTIPALSIVGTTLGLFLMIVGYSWILVDMDKRIEDVEYKV
jgi:uncharacterized membrane protein YgdD (TMEM256/DUF423 family)